MYKRQRWLLIISKTAYEMSASLVGSEMCIRDSFGAKQSNEMLKALKVKSKDVKEETEDDGKNA